MQSVRTRKLSGVPEAASGALPCNAAAAGGMDVQLRIEGVQKAGTEVLKAKLHDFWDFFEKRAFTG